MNNPKILALLAYKNISSTSNNLRRTYSNTYPDFQNNYNTIKINEINKQFCSDLDVAGRVYLNIYLVISNILKSHYLCIYAPVL